MSEEKKICTNEKSSLDPGTDSPGVKIARELSSEEHELQAGCLVGGFEIIRKLGKGGMGTVYLAMQKSMQRQIALKVLNPEITKDAESVEQFLKEVRNTGKLQHPNIVNAFDSGEENGVYYLAMQYINGDTFDNLLQQNGPMNEIKALEYAIQIAGALEYVWSKYQMFHRDIKPGNFMLNDDNKAMLMDLGIAQKIGETSGDEEHVEGSPYYMSPEQIQGKALSWTTDQYSLGASLYQIIVGVPPYDDKTIDDILKKHCLADFPAPAERKPDCKISPETVSILKKMMEKDPAKRFDSWESFIGEAKKCIELLKEIEKNPEKRLEIDAAAAEKAKQEKEKKKKRIRTIILSAVGVLFAGAIVGGYFLLSAKNTGEAQRMTKEIEEAYRKFSADPAKNQQMRESIDSARNAAGRIGVPEELSAQLKQSVAEIEKKYNQLYTSFTKFERDSSTCSKDAASVKQLLAELSSGSMSYDKLQLAAGNLSILEKRINGLKPATQVQKEQQQRLYGTFDVLKKSLEQCRERLLQQEQSKSEAELAQISRQTDQQNAENARRINQQLAQQEAEGKRKAAEARRKAQAAENSKKSVKVQKEKQEVDRFLPMIEKEKKRIQKEFLDAWVSVDIRKAAAITISDEIKNAELSTSKAKLAYAALEQEYKISRQVVDEAMIVWDKLHDLDNMLLVRGLQVQTPPINNRLRAKYKMLRVQKIQDGKVYFQEESATPEEFIYLEREDKNKIAVNLIQRANLMRYQTSFYLFFGMYDLAYQNASAQERTKIIALAKKIVKLQYQAAKASGDVRVLQRLTRDYGSNKTMSDIFK